MAVLYISQYRQKELCMSIKATTLITLFAESTSINASVEGYDYYKTSNYVEFEDSCFHEGSDTYLYDYRTSNYHNVLIENMDCYQSGCEIEVYDYNFGEYRYITLEGRVCS